MTPEELAAAGLRYDVQRRGRDRHPEPARGAQRPDAHGCGGRWPPSATRCPTTSGWSSSAGEGQSFSAGLDRAMLDPATSADDPESVVGLLGRSDEEISETVDRFQRGFTWLRDPRFVSVAVVQGHAIGAGFQLALSCDLRVVGDDAQFCMKEPALGLVPDLTGTKPLVESVGYARALEICATARVVGAAEALEIGLATVVCPVAELDGALADLVGALTAPMAGRRPRDQGAAAGGVRTLARRAAAVRARGTDPPVPRARGTDGRRRELTAVGRSGGRGTRCR